jgi:Ca2+/Na+ antiporter
MAIKLHALSPLLLTGIFLVALAAALPAAVVNPIAAMIGRFERATGAVGVILVLAIVYWIARLCYAPMSLPR